MPFSFVHLEQTFAKMSVPTRDMLRATKEISVGSDVGFIKICQHVFLLLVSDNTLESFMLRHIYISVHSFSSIYWSKNVLNTIVQKGGRQIIYPRDFYHCKICKVTLRN